MRNQQSSGYSLRRGLKRDSSPISQPSADGQNILLQPAIATHSDGETDQNQKITQLTRCVSPVITSTDLMGIVKRGPKNDEMARASAQKARQYKPRELHAGATSNKNILRNAVSTVPIRGKSPLIEKRKSSQNLDLMHMTNADDQHFQRVQSTHGDNNTTKKSLQASDFDVPNQIIMNPAMIPAPETTEAKKTLNAKPRIRPASQYARFKLQESIKALAQPKQIPICGPRLKELSNVVFEQQVAQGYNISISSKHKPSAEANHGNQLHVKPHPDAAGGGYGANQNFSGPFYISQNFRSHKVGEQFQKHQEKPHRPYHLKLEVAPPTTKQQSLYSRQCRQQMSAAEIIREQHTIASQSSRLLFRPQSGRIAGPTLAQSQADTRLQRQRSSNFQTSLKLSITCDGRGRASLVPATTTHIAERIYSAKVTDYADLSRQGTGFGLVSSGPASTVDPAQKRSSRIKSGRATKTLQATPQSRLNSAKPRTVIKGDELKIQQKKIFDAGETVSRHTRIEAYETERLRAAFAEQQQFLRREKEYQKQFEKKQHEDQENRGEILNKTVLSIQAYASRASTSRFEEMTPQANMTHKNITVLDKIPMPAHDRSQEVLNDTVACKRQETLKNSQIINDQSNAQLLDQQQQQSDQPGNVDQSHRKNYESIDMGMSSNEGAASPKDYLTQNNDKQELIPQLQKPPVKRNSVCPKKEKQEDEAGDSSRQIQPQYSSQVTLAKKLDQILTNSDITPSIQLPGLQDLKSISSGGRRQSAGNLVSHQITESQSPHEVVEVEPGFNIISKSRLNRIRQEERRTQAQKREHRHTSAEECQRCQGQEIEATKRQIDKGYQSTARSKIFFKPSVVEIHDQSEPVPEGSPPAPEVDKRARKGKQQLYILSPQSPQEDNNLGAIKEEQSQTAIYNASLEDSRMMQAFLQACEDGPALNEMAENPEAREFILYLQQVQPELLFKQNNNATSRSITDRKATLSASDEMLLMTPQHAAEYASKAELIRTQLVSRNNAKDAVSKTSHASFSANAAGCEHQVQVVTSYRRDPANQVILEETVGENQLRSSLGIAVTSQETLPGQANSPLDVDVYVSEQQRSSNDIIQADLLSKDQLDQPNEDIFKDTLRKEDLAAIDNQLSPFKQQQRDHKPEGTQINASPVQIPIAHEHFEMTTEEANHDKGYRFDEKPVNYDCQIEMMQNIFRQISNQRANATRATVKGQKIIFQPTVREFRRLDFKPVTVDGRRYPPPPDSMIPQPRPPTGIKVKQRLSRNQLHRRAQTQEARRDANEERQQKSLLKLHAGQVGHQGQFQSLLHRKRAEKIVTWDTEPPKVTKPSIQHSHSGSQNAPSVSYYCDENGNPISPELFQQFCYQQQQQWQLMQELDTNPNDYSQGQAANKPQMSAIREVSSVSQRQYVDTDGSIEAVINKNGQRKQRNRSREVPLSDKSKTSQARQGEGNHQQAGSDNSIRIDLHQIDGGDRTTNTAHESTKMTHITGWTNRNTPHRRGKPVGAEVASEEGQRSQADEDNINSVKDQDDTFAGLFYDKKQADAFKAGQIMGSKITATEQPETIEWSDSEYQKKRDEYGNVLTHKGNIIKRGFNVAQQSKPRVVCTNDPALLRNVNLQKKFDDSKYRMSNYISDIGPPRKKLPEMTKQQWKRIQRAQFTYENLEEKPKTQKKNRHQNQRKRNDYLKKYNSQNPITGEPEKNYAKMMPSVSKLKGDYPKEQVIEGNLFKFDNAERYKTDQLREQALALLVPGYLSYVYDIN